MRSDYAQDSLKREPDVQVVTTPVDGESETTAASSDLI